MRIESRRSRVPAVSYPDSLPVSQRKDDLLAAIRDHQVVIVAGETGSGKTTQLPKICLEAGRGVQGLIGHTQPRRIAARAVAERIAEELGTPLGDLVGWKVRFSDKVSRDSLIKVMTDGILLAEIQNDRMLNQYDTLIIDEAHERSLNIDFILGYLKQLLPRRQDLKVIITSATIDPERFSRHFEDAPVIEVSGRTFPVEVRYRPFNEGDEDRDQVQAICDAVAELETEAPGDVLVFLSGEREIRDTADALRQLHLKGTEILPLYARLSAAEQHRVFQPHPGRRIVLATNVAETSLTVPGIRYVIDPGTARISRYSTRLKVQRLPIEPVSQASADQRKGRCGRLADGICIRLYAEEDFSGRSPFTDPEILRTNLASVILQMAALGLGEMGDFPFVEPPDRRHVRDGVQLLEELGALDPPATDPRRRLTQIGKQLAQLPVDPRLGRMILEADRNGCLREMLVIAAGLSIQDPRERPAEHEAAAAQTHARFQDKNSDFLAYVNLWNHLQEQQNSLSSSQFRKLCKREFLNYLRVREWQDVVSQLRQSVRSLGMKLGSLPAEVAPDSPIDADRIHQSLLAGLLSHIGMKTADRQDFLGARGARFAIFPGSSLFKKQPRWVVAAELVETSRLWGRVVARIEPEWVEPLAEHLVKRTYSEPHWEKTRGSVMAYEKVTLYGVPIVAARKVSYGQIDPELSRELFIRHALVEGDWRTHHTFWHANRRAMEAVEQLEHRLRRRVVVVDDETLFGLYDERIPKDVVSQRHFDRWWKSERRITPDLLTFTENELMNAGARSAEEDAYPDSWRVGDVELPLSYRFEPGAPNDGVTVEIPLPALGSLDVNGRFEWHVPGLREDLVIALIRSLPKAVRVSLVPVPDRARELLTRLRPLERPLLEALEDELRGQVGISVTRGDWDWSKVPDHLRFTFHVVDSQKRLLARGKDLDALRQQLAPKVRTAVAHAAASIERDQLADWSVGTIPRTFSATRDGHPVTAYPALVDEGNSVALRALSSSAAQDAAHLAGVRRLILLTLSAPTRKVIGQLSNEARLALGRSPYANVTALLDDCIDCAVTSLIDEQGGPAWDEAAFIDLRTTVRAGLQARLLEIVKTASQVMTLANSVDRRLSAQSTLVALGSLTDARQHLDRLVRPGFITDAGWPRLLELVRYLRALDLRLDRLPGRVERDRDLTGVVQQLEREHRELVDSLPPDAAPDPQLDNVRWMLEELRVSLFAQTLGTPYPISEKRVLRALDTLTA